MRLLLALLLWPTILSAQTARVYLQAHFKNGGASVIRDSAGILVTIGSTTDPRRTLFLRPHPLDVLALTVRMQGPLPTDTMEFKPKSATWRCAPSGCWVTFTTPGLGSYFRPSPNFTASHFPRLRLALIAALQGLDVPPYLLDLR